MKHPSLRVKNVLDLHPSIIDEFENLGKGFIVVILPYLPEGVIPIDLEVCGDLANNDSKLHSDIDMALVMKDWNEQIILRRLLEDNLEVKNAVSKIKTDFDIKWGTRRIDLGVNVPDNKQSAEKYGWAVYSVFERKLYGKAFDFTKQWLKLSPYTQRYTPTPYDLNGVFVASKFEVPALNVSAKWAYDEWDKDGTTDKWRKIYGDKFLEYKVINKPEGGTELSE